MYNEQGQEEQSVIELELDRSDGVYKASGISREREQGPQRRQKVMRGSRKPNSRAVRELQRIAQCSPQFEQFISGANQALDIFERVFDVHAKFKKAMR